MKHIIVRKMSLLGSGVYLNLSNEIVTSEVPIKGFSLTCDKLENWDGRINYKVREVYKNYKCYVEGRNIPKFFTCFWIINLLEGKCIVAFKVQDNSVENYFKYIIKEKETSIDA